MLQRHIVRDFCQGSAMFNLGKNEYEAGLSELNFIIEKTPQTVLKIVKIA